MEKKSFMRHVYTIYNTTYSQIYKFKRPDVSLRYESRNHPSVFSLGVENTMRRFAEGTERQGTPGGFTGATSIHAEKTKRIQRENPEKSWKM